MCAAFRPRFRRRDADHVAGSGSADDASDLPEAEAEADGDGDEWLAYELHEWSLESRVMLQQLLAVDKVVHSWQGTTLMVHESLEEQVDSLIDEAEEAEKAKEATSRPIGPDDDLTAFEVGDWSPEMRAELVERLVQARVPHILEESAAAGDQADGDDAAGDEAAGDEADGDDAEESAAAGDEADGDDAEESAAAGDEVDGDDAEESAAAGDEVDGDDSGGWDLWVREADEERVDLVIDDMLARVEEAGMEELDGLEVNDLLSGLFVACDRLRRDPRDLEGARGALTNARRVAGVRTPFGFAATGWRDLRGTANELAALVQADDSDEEDLRELAHRLSDSLRTLI